MTAPLRCTCTLLCGVFRSSQLLPQQYKGGKGLPQIFWKVVLRSYLVWLTQQAKIVRNVLAPSPDMPLSTLNVLLRLGVFTLLLAFGDCPCCPAI